MAHSPLTLPRTPPYMVNNIFTYILLYRCGNGTTPLPTRAQEPETTSVSFAGTEPTKQHRCLWPVRSNQRTTPYGRVLFLADFPKEPLRPCCVLRVSFGVLSYDGTYLRATPTGRLDTARVGLLASRRRRLSRSLLSRAPAVVFLSLSVCAWLGSWC